MRADACVPRVSPETSITGITYWRSLALHGTLPGLHIKKYQNQMN